MKEGRYQRIVEQLHGLLQTTPNLPSQIATVNAVLHHKLSKVLWTGFYMLVDGELLVSAYQGPLACQRLAKDKGVCWAAINTKKAIIVEDVHQFDGHIACDSRSKSEIVIPLINSCGNAIGCLDIDSEHLANFDEIDEKYLTEIVALLNIA